MATPIKIEGREVRNSVMDIRAIIGADGAPSKIIGHAAKFNSLSQDLGGYFERIAPGAFAMSILEDDIRVLWNHDSNIVLGRNKAGTMRIVEDEIGLAYEVDTPDTQYVRDMVVSPIVRGDVSQCSFAFRCIEDRWDKIDGVYVRTLLKCKLYEVSPVTFPAYLDTNVATRSLEQYKALTSSEPAYTMSTDMRKRYLDLAELS